MSLVPKPPSVELLARTTYTLIRPFEAMALMLQATNLFMSTLNDRYRDYGVPIVVTLGAVHLVLAVLVLRHPGPLTRGHAWTLVWIAMIFVTQLVIAHLLAPGDFAAFGNGVPVGNYALIPLAVFAFYPWSGFRSRRRRWLIECALIVAITLHPLLILGLMHQWDFTAEHWQSVLQYGVWAVVWFLVGKGIAWLCLIAVEVETKALTRSYQAALGDIHSYLDTAANSIANGRDPRVVGRDLREVIYERRRQLRSENEQVDVVDLFENAVRLYRDRLTFVSTPQLGGLALPSEPAMILEHGLADLLKNAVDHGGGAVELAFTLEDAAMTLDVRDNGPGLPRAVFEDPTTGMHQLRTKLRTYGGDLELRDPGPGGGTAIRLTLPLPERR